MKTLADDIAIAGRKLDDKDLVGYILTGLDNDFDPVISTVSAHVEPISISELYVQLIYHEQRQELRGKNLASRGQGGPPAHGSPNHGRGRGRGRGFYNNKKDDYNRIECQLGGRYSLPCKIRCNLTCHGRSCSHPI
jgi:hypothetical protein